jgi:hypothetical protein
MSTSVERFAGIWKGQRTARCARNMLLAVMSDFAWNAA